MYLKKSASDKLFFLELRRKRLGESIRKTSHSPRFSWVLDVALAAGIIAFAIRANDESFDFSTLLSPLWRKATEDDSKSTNNNLTSGVGKWKSSIRPAGKAKQ